MLIPTVGERYPLRIPPRIPCIVAMGTSQERKTAVELRQVGFGQKAFLPEDIVGVGQGG